MRTCDFIRISEELACERIVWVRVHVHVQYVESGEFRFRFK